MTNITQEKILLTASRLFYNNGIRCTGIDRIIKEAETSKMSFYKYYPSKNELIIAYLLRQEKIFMDRYDKMSSKTTYPRVKILAIFEINEALINCNTFKGCPFFNALSEFSSERESVHQVVIEILNRFSLLIQYLTEQCEVNQPKSVALQLTVLLHGSILSGQVMRNTAVTKHAKEIAEMILK